MEIRRTPLTLVLALILLVLAGVTISNAVPGTPAGVVQDVPVRTNPPTNLTPDDPGAMPTVASEAAGAESTTVSSSAPRTVDPSEVDSGRPSTSATSTTRSTPSPPARNPVLPTDGSQPEPVTEAAEPESTFNPVLPTESTTPTN